MSSLYLYRTCSIRLGILRHRLAEVCKPQISSARLRGYGQDINIATGCANIFSFFILSEIVRSKFKMVHMKFLASLVQVFWLLDASAIPSHQVVHEKRESLHPRWTKAKRVESHKYLPMRIGLAQTNLDHGYEHLMDV
jgi:hypothetical protein